MYQESNSSKDFDNQNELSRPISSYSVNSQKFRLEGKKAPNNSKESNKDENEKGNNEPKKKNACLIFISFFLKNFGILVLVILYLAGGAFLFKLLEQHNEIQGCQMGEGEWNKIRISFRSKLFNYIYFNTTSNPWLPVDNATKAAGLYTVKEGPNEYNPKLREWFIDFREQILKIRDEKKYTGQDCEKQSSWTYFSALLFTITILTTLGYGHVSPTTWEGQIVCICYAILGIPLFVMSTVKVSTILGDMFRFLYGNVFCYFCHKSNRKSQKTENDEEENQTDKGYDFYDENNTNQKKVHVVDDNDEYENDNENDKDKDNVSVPLILVLGAFVGYLVLGAYIFTLLEPTWSMIEAVYFAYISLSTIGFGDYVPGINQVLEGNEAEGGRNLLIATIYIYIGLAILGMCFQLMQDEVAEKINLLTAKLGCGKKEEKESKVEFIIPNQTDSKEDKNESDETKENNNIREATIISVRPKLEIDDSNPKGKRETSC